MSEQRTTRAWARGGAVFAATVMLIVGVFQVFEGIAAIARSSFYVVAPNYAFNLSTTTWGWIHLVIGAVVFLTGLSLLATGSLISRIIGVAVVALSAIGNFFFVPYYPLWSLLIIAVDVFVIWSLASMGSRQQMERDAMDYQMSNRYETDDRSRWPATQGSRTREQTAAADQPGVEAHSTAGGTARTSESGMPRQQQPPEHQ